MSTVPRRRVGQRPAGLAAAVAVLLGSALACTPTGPQHVAGVVVDEHASPVPDARVVVGYYGWAWEPYLVWDHFYSVTGTTDARGRFGLDLDAPERLFATVETDRGALRNVSVLAGADLRFITPASGPACECWAYDGPMFLAQAPIGTTSQLSTTTGRHDQQLGALPHRLRVERASENPRQITLTVAGGDSDLWFPDDGTYGSLLDYHPPLERFDFGAATTTVRLGQARGLVILQDEDDYLVLEVGTGYGTQSAGPDNAVELLLLPARWARRSS